MLKGQYPAFSVDPEGIIAHDFNNLNEAKEYVKKLNPPTKHWMLYGTINDNFAVLYEEKNGIVIKNEFENL